MGRGINLIRRTCIADGRPAPKFDCDSTGFWVEFPFPLLVSEKSSDRSGEAKKTPVKTLVKTPDLVIQYLAKNPSMTLAEVATAIGKSLSAVERASAKLVKDGRLEYVGPKKDGRWEVLI